MIENYKLYWPWHGYQDQVPVSVGTGTVRKISTCTTRIVSPCMSAYALVCMYTLPSTIHTSKDP